MTMKTLQRKQYFSTYKPLNLAETVRPEAAQETNASQQEIPAVASGSTQSVQPQTNETSQNENQNTRTLQEYSEKAWDKFHDKAQDRLENEITDLYSKMNRSDRLNEQIEEYNEYDRPRLDVASARSDANVQRIAADIRDKEQNYDVSGMTTPETSDEEGTVVRREYKSWFQETNKINKQLEASEDLHPHVLSKLSEEDNESVLETKDLNQNRLTQQNEVLSKYAEFEAASDNLREMKASIRATEQQLQRDLEQQYRSETAENSNPEHLPEQSSSETGQDSNPESESVQQQGGSQTRSSLIDDYADVSTQMPSHMDPDD